MPKRLCMVMALACASCATTGSQPLKIAVTDATLDYFTAADARFTVQVRLSNPNAADLAVEAMNAELRLENVAIGTASLAAPVRVPARGDVTASVVAAPDLLSSLRASGEITRRFRAEKQAAPVVSYAVTGTVTLEGGVVVPFSRAGEFKLGLAAPTR